MSDRNEITLPLPTFWGAVRTAGLLALGMLAVPAWEGGYSILTGWSAQHVAESGPAWLAGDEAVAERELRAKNGRVEVEVEYLERLESTALEAYTVEAPVAMND